MLIIFDCDGVLVDTEGKSADVFSNVLKKNGVNLTAQHCMTQFRGWTLKKCEEWLIKNKTNEFNHGVYPADFISQINDATLTGFESGVEPIEGVCKLVNTLVRRQIAFCVASNGEHRKMNMTLSASGLLPYFAGKIFSAQDVAIGKPSPALFLHAAHSMGYPPEKCWVIEDSPSGVQAALAAGMNVIAYSPSKNTELQIEERVRVLASMSEVEDMLLEPLLSVIIE